MRRAKKKGSKGQRTKPPIPTLSIDALIGDDEQNVKQKRTKRNRSGSPTRLPWIYIYISLGVQEKKKDRKTKT